MLRGAVKKVLLADRLGEAVDVVFAGPELYSGVTIYAVFLETVSQFYLMAAAVGCVQGAVQSMSRALFAQLVPEDKAAEFFGFYNMIGKFAAVVGPFLVGFAALASDDPKVSIFVLLPLYVRKRVVIKDDRNEVQLVVNCGGQLLHGEHETTVAAHLHHGLVRVRRGNAQRGRKTVAERYGISIPTTYRWEEADILPKAKKIGPNTSRFDGDELIERERSWDETA